MDVLTEFLESIAPEERELVRELDALVRRAAPGLAPSLKWGNLTYHGEKNVCAIVAHRRHVNLQIWGASGLPDPRGLLAGSGKAMRHVRLAPGEPFDHRAVAALVRAAARA